MSYRTGDLICCCGEQTTAGAKFCPVHDKYAGLSATEIDGEVKVTIAPRSPEGEKPDDWDAELRALVAMPFMMHDVGIAALASRIRESLRSTEASTDGRVAKARRLLWEEAEAVCPDDPDRQYDIILHEQIRRADAAPPSTPDEVGYVVIGQRVKGGRPFLCFDGGSVETDREECEDPMLTLPEARATLKTFRGAGLQPHYTYAIHPIGHSTGESE